MMNHHLSNNEENPQQQPPPKLTLTERLFHPPIKLPINFPTTTTNDLKRKPPPRFQSPKSKNTVRAPIDLATVRLQQFSNDTDNVASRFLKRHSKEMNLQQNKTSEPQQQLSDQQKENRSIESIKSTERISTSEIVRNKAFSVTLDKPKSDVQSLVQLEKANKLSPNSKGKGSSKQRIQLSNRESAIKVSSKIAKKHFNNNKKFKITEAIPNCGIINNKMKSIQSKEKSLTIVTSDLTSTKSIPPKKFQEKSSQTVDLYSDRKSSCQKMEIFHDISDDTSSSASSCSSSSSSESSPECSKSESSSLTASSQGSKKPAPENGENLLKLKVLNGSKSNSTPSSKDTGECRSPVRYTIFNRCNQSKSNKFKAKKMFSTDESPARSSKTVASSSKSSASSTKIWASSSESLALPSKTSQKKMNKDEESNKKPEKYEPEDRTGMDDDEYYVEKIMGRRISSNKVQYYVKWKNYSEIESTWEPIKNVISSLETVKEYESSLLDRKSAKELSSKLTAIEYVPPPARNSVIEHFIVDVIGYIEERESFIVQFDSDELPMYSIEEFKNTPPEQRALFVQFLDQCGQEYALEQTNHSSEDSSSSFSSESESNYELWEVSSLKKKPKKSNKIAKLKKRKSEKQKVWPSKKPK